MVFSKSLDCWVQIWHVIASPGVLEPGEAISYPVTGLPRREKTAAGNDISDFEKAMELSYFTPPAGKRGLISL
jgi:hypothetical protein